MMSPRDVKCIYMYNEEAKKERFVSLTRIILQSSQRSDWMPQLDCIIAHNLTCGGV